jgi:adenosylmethionine-8-amino-7-oxononanoate aminotransferase
MIFSDDYIIWHPTTQMQTASIIPMRRAQGAWLYPQAGQPILDAIGSWWVNIHGHCHPALVEAVREQASVLDQVIFAGCSHMPAEQLCQALRSHLPPGLDCFFFSDDGSTATEVALKMAVQYYHHLGQPRTRILALDGGYHGDTFGAMSVSGVSAFLAPFEPLLFEVERLPYPASPDTLTEALAALDLSRYAAFIYEPLIQGAAGMRIYPPDHLAPALRQLREAGVFLVADEVFTGFGRTGRFFASDFIPETSPDFICMSKGLTGGFLPMGLTVTTRQVYEAFLGPHKDKAFLHGHSFTANPLACVAALASIQLLEAQPLSQYQHQLTTLYAALPEHLPANALNYRTLGAVAAFEIANTTGGYLSTQAQLMYRTALEHHILLRPMGQTYYLTPPYPLTDTDTEYALNQTCKTVKRVGELLATA